MTEPRVITEIDGHVAHVRLNRPDKLNALADRVIAELGEAIDELRGRDDVAGIILTGAGRAFIAGADISEIAGREPIEAKVPTRTVLRPKSRCVVTSRSACSRRARHSSQ